MGSNSTMLQLEELINKKNYTDDGKRIIRYSDDYHSNDIKRTMIVDDDGLFVLYDEYRYTYENGHSGYERLSTMEIYKDQYGNMHLVDPDAFIPYCQYTCWIITGSLPSIGYTGGIYIVRNSSYETKEEMEEALLKRAECEHKYMNNMSSAFISNGTCHCNLCGKSWTYNKFKDYYANTSPAGSINVRYIRYDITVIKKEGRDFVTARADRVFSFGYDGPRSHIIASPKHYITASNIILAARAFYELGYFDYEESAYIYVMYGENDGFIRGISAEYPTNRFGKFLNKLFKRIPHIMYARSKMKDFEILESTKNEFLIDYKSKIEEHSKEYKKSKKKSNVLDYDGLEKYVEMARENQRRFGVEHDHVIGDLLISEEIF